MTADDVWHRALDGPVPGDAELRAGDVALAALLVVHGTVMNGGVLHAVTDSFSSSELDAAEHGFRWFGLDAAARVLVETRATVAPGNLTLEQLGALEREADDRYDAAVPSDEHLIEVFEARVAADPAAFAPT